MKNYTNIFDYITSQESDFKNGIRLAESWLWSFKEHVQTTFLYTHSQLLTGKSDFKPVKNIIKQILNLQHRTEDIELKDVQIYVDDPDKYHLSFLVRKYHDDVFSQENDLDTFFDELNVSRIDYGGGLSKQLNKPCPEVVSLQSIAFCDQTDLLSGAIGLKHFYSPDQLLDMEKVGWGKESNGATITIKELISLSKDEKTIDKTQQATKTPSRYVEVYEVHGNLPKRFADNADDSEEYESRLFICAFYNKKDGMDKQGVILYTALEKESPFKLIKRDPVYGRALGFGGAEELFEAQVWTNYDMIRMQDMLDAASKTVLVTTDPSYSNKNKIRDMENLEVTVLAENTKLEQVNTFPRNLQLFEQSTKEWETHAKNIGASQDPLEGKEPTSGTPFASLQAQIQQGMGLHEYRRGIFAKHLEEIYKDWIIPHIEKEIFKGTKFLSELSLEELQYVIDCVVRGETNKMVKTKILNGEEIDPVEVEAFKAQVMTNFKKKGNKHFIEILKGEFKEAKLGVKVSIAGKSKNLARQVDKLTNIFRTVVMNPAMLQNPAIAGLFNQILEASGLEQVDFSNFEIPPAAQPQSKQPQSPQQLQQTGQPVKSPTQPQPVAAQ